MNINIISIPHVKEVQKVGGSYDADDDNDSNNTSLGKAAPGLFGRMRRAATLTLGDNDDGVEERYLHDEDDSINGGAGKDVMVHASFGVGW